MGFHMSIRCRVAEWFRVGLLLSMFGVALPLQAHHSFAMFDKQRFTTIKGTLNKIDWRNPHVYLLVDVPNEKGEVTQYAVEGSSPNELGRWGWKKSSIKPGEVVTVEIYPLKDGRAGGLLYSVTLPDGSVLKAN